MRITPSFVRGEKVFLRAIEEQDLDFFVAIRNNVSLQALLMCAPKAHSRQQVQDWLAKAEQDQQRLMLAIVETASNNTVGYLQLANLQLVHGTAELGICLSPESQGKGFGREAIQLLDGFAYQFLRIRKLILKVVSFNDIAMKLYQTIGFREVGVLREEFWTFGKHHDVIIMEKFTTLGSNNR